MCAECGHELFSSISKFEHSSPWPAFSETLHKDSVSKHPEAWGPIKVEQLKNWFQDGIQKLKEGHLFICFYRFVVENVATDWAMSFYMMDPKKVCPDSESSAAR